MLCICFVVVEQAFSTVPTIVEVLAISECICYYDDVIHCVIIALLFLVTLILFCYYDPSSINHISTAGITNTSGTSVFLYFHSL